MIFLKTEEEIEKVWKASQLVAATLAEVAKEVAPGVTTRHLDNIAREFILDNGGKPACLGYCGFPGTLCIEVNEMVVHGFPSSYTLREGDIVGCDCVATLDGFNGDSCYTFPVGEVDEKVRNLLQTTLDSLYVGIAAAQSGRRIGDISNAVQTYCEKRNFSVVREYCGHGIGKSMHEDPQISNYGRRGTGPVIRNGMCLCVEPMINMGSKNTVILPDKWQCRTKDGKPSAHYEHTFAMVNDRPVILTSFEGIKEVMGERFIGPAAELEAKVRYYGAEAAVEAPEESTKG